MILPRLILPLVLAICVSGCSRPGLTEGDNARPNHLEEPRLGFSMVNAAFWTNGILRSERVTRSIDDFKMLFVHLPESGLYIVTIDRTDGSNRSGRFSGSELLFSAGRTEIRFRSQEGHLFSDRVDRAAWVEFLPDFRISESGDRSDVVIVDLVRERTEIPGL